MLSDHESASCGSFYTLMLILDHQEDGQNREWKSDTDIYEGAAP